MTDLDRTVPIRTPSTLTVRTLPAPTPRPRTEIMSAPRQEYWPLIAEAGRLEERGEIRRLRRNPVWSHERQAWEIPIRRLKEAKPAPPAWRKPLLVAGLIAIPMVALAATGWWLVNALSEPALLTFLGVAGAAFLALLWSGRRRSGTVTATAIAIASVTVKR